MPEAINPSSQEYLDFDLEIGPGDGSTYPVAVLDSPSGETRGVMQWPYDKSGLHTHLVELENVLLRSATPRRVVSTEDERTVETFGSTLFTALFTNEVRSRYEVSLERARMQGKGLRIKLRIQAPDLASLPWEFLYDPTRDEYLCFSGQTPIVRYPDLPLSIQPLEVSPPLRILGMVASPRGLPVLNVAAEKARLSQPLARLQEAGLVELHWLEGETWRDLQRIMRQGPWHVFHFIGHGGFNSQRQEGFLALCDEAGDRDDLRATQLARLIAGHPSLRLVVLNACEGGRSSQDDIFSSTASILLRGGVPAALAMQYAITDQAAVEFARTFYEALADGMPVDAAVVEGRVAISLTFDDSIEWATPVLYLRAEDGVLFEVDKSHRLIPHTTGALVELPAQPAPDSQVQPPPVEQSPNRETSSVPSMDSIPQPQPLLRRIPQVSRVWWAAGAAGLVLLCILLAMAAKIPQHVLALLVPQPSATLTQTPSETTPVPNALLEPSQTAAFDLAVVFTATETATPHTATAVQPEPSLTATAASLPAITASETPTETAAPELQTGDTQVSPKDGMLMVYIPPGEFQMGCDPQNNAGFPCSNDELLHLLFLDAYWFDQTQVTNAMYAKCVAAGACEPPIAVRSSTRSNYFDNPEYADFPVIFVSWDKAVAYCEWAGRRLPTEAEWEKAARGDVDNRVYPWGNDLPTCDVANFKNDSACVGDTSPAGDYPAGASPYGVLGLAGNVWDWVSDYYANDYYMTSPKINPQGPESGQNRVIRGACWVNNPFELRSSNRFFAAGFLNYDDIGFRCAATAAAGVP